MVREKELTKGTYVQFVANLGVGFQFAVERAIPVTSDETAVLRFYWVLARDFGVDDGEEGI